MADQRVRLNRNHRVRTCVILCIQLQHTECFDDGRLEVHALVLCQEAGIAVESHTDCVVKEARGWAVWIIATRRLARSGAVWRFEEDVVRPVLLVALRLHKETVASHALTVQRARTRDSAQTGTCTTVILQILVDIDHI